MGTRIKIVADATPNDDGTWIDIDAEAPQTTSWIKTELALRPFVPKGYHLVALGGRVEQVPANRFSGLDL